MEWDLFFPTLPQAARGQKKTSSPPSGKAGYRISPAAGRIGRLSAKTIGIRRAPKQKHGEM